MLGRRDARHHDTDAARKVAGVDPRLWWEHKPGDRVLTVEGLIGTVDAVEDGPFPGAEQYLVTLDNGLGGGEYGPSELRAAPTRQAASEQHLASEDYPELADILVERPPLPEVIPETMEAPLSFGASKVAFVLDKDPPDKPGSLSTSNGLPLEADVCRNCGRARYIGNEGLCQECAEFGHPVTDDFDAPLGAQVPTRPWSETNTIETHDRIAHLGETIPTHIGGMFDRVIDKAIDKWTDKTGYEPGHARSYDWCRFRKNSRCFYPKQLDEEGTKQAGYAVWVPEDRGYCPRIDWDAQRACPVGEPGPNSREPNAKPDATVSWEEGGQRWSSLQTTARYLWPDGNEISFGDLLEIAKKSGLIDEGRATTFASDPRKYDTRLKQVLADTLYSMWARGEISMDSSPYEAPTYENDPTAMEWALNQRAAALDDPEFTWHFTAAWRDVQAKAKRLRTDGKVRIISVSGATVSAEVRGDNNLYRTSIQMSPGGNSVAMWECGCAWASYSWGRTGKWKRYEGRMCSHALALTYEAQAGRMFGRELQEQPARPSWRRDTTIPVREPTNYPKPDKKSSLVVAGPPAFDVNMPAHIKDLAVEDIAEWMLDQAQHAERHATRDVTDVANKYFGELKGLDFRVKSLDSLKRKLLDRSTNPKVIQGDPFSVVRDALRYTIAFPEPDWSNSVQKALWSLQERGYQIVEEEQSWPRGDPYSGSHYTLVGRDGVPIELQFHTSDSFNLKNRVIHRMYEEFRDKSTPLKRRQELYDLMSPYWDQVAVPEHARDFPNEKFYERPTARKVNLDPSLHVAPVQVMAESMLSDGVAPSDVFGYVASLTPNAVPIMKQALSVKPFSAKVRGWVRRVLELLDDGTARTEAGDVPVDQIYYPTYDPRLGLSLNDSKPFVATLNVTAEADTSGVMICLVPPRDLLEKLALADDPDAEPVDQMHITMAYLGDGADLDRPTVEQAVEEWAVRWGPLTGRIGGYGIFLNNEDKVLVALIDAPGLEKAREDLIDTLAAHGIVAADDHGYTPHLTLKYSGEANTPDVPDNPPEGVLGEWQVEAVTLSWGDEWVWYEFTSGENVMGEVRKAAHWEYPPESEALFDAASTIMSQAQERAVWVDDGCGLDPDPLKNTASSAPTAPEGWDGAAPEPCDSYESDPDEPGTCKNCWWARGAHSVEAGGPDGHGGFGLPKQSAWGDTGTWYDEGYADQASDGHPDLGMVQTIFSEDGLDGVAEYAGGVAQANNDVLPDSMAWHGVGLPEDGTEAREDLGGGSTNSMPWLRDAGPEATLHDEPEPALPATDGADEVQATTELGDEPTLEQLRQGMAWLEGTKDRRAAHAQENSEIAAMAKRVAKMGMKAFSPAEQAQIIDEGEGVTAANLDRLEIAGTHYEVLEAKLAEEEEGDASWLML